MSLDFFLTAYDPSDLPGTSIDPLGFERGYLFLADRILPGLTNVAARPRYFGMLCAGIHLAGVDSTTPPRSAYSQRLPVLLRMERLWGLANVLASSSRGDAEGQLQGIRGLRYLQARSVVLGDRRMTQTSADFRVLSRQVQYGVVGIYAAVAQGMRMLGDRRALSLTPDLGDRLGEAFVDETEMPAPIRTAVKDDKPVSLAVLADWGGRAHVSGRAGAEERRCLRDAVIRNAVRLRMTRLLAEHQAEEGEEELQRLTRVERSLRDREEDEDLRDAVQAIIAYEGAYRIAQLALERLIWLCRKSPALDVRNCEGDEVLQLVLQRLPKSVGKLQGILDAAKSFGFGSDLTAMEDVRRFLADAALAAGNSAPELIEVVLSRHRDVQHGKFDRGRRKMPWIERVNGRIAFTSAQVGGLSREARHPTEIAPHFYRTASADALRVAAGIS